MPGKLGDDFDVTQPSNSSLVKQGALWIRGIKSAVKSFASVMFDLETGNFKDNVISSGALQNSGVVAGTYTEVTVNEKGLVTLGANPVEQKVANVYRAVFTTLDAFYDTDTGTSSLTGTAGGPKTPASGAPFFGSYTTTLDGFSYVTYTFKIPAGVRRLKAIIAGGGGGGHAAGGGGGGGEHVEVTFPVTPLTNISVIVAQGGGVDGPGGVSLVDVGSLHAEAGGGGAGGAGTGGAAVSDPAGTSGTLTVLRCLGSAGTAGGTAGASGSYLINNTDGNPYGKGGAAGVVGQDGIVILEWFA